jgi:hypothetical protein
VQRNTLPLAAALSIACTSIFGQESAAPYLTSRKPLTILSGNDGLMHARTGTNAKVTSDSITVVHLGPDHPPIVKTVYGTVPNTISGAPYMAMTGDGRYGFVTSRKLPHEPGVPEIVSAIDLASPELTVVSTAELTNPKMAAMHPDGKHLLVPYDTGVRVFEMRDGRLEVVKDTPTEVRLYGMAVSPKGDLIAGNGKLPDGKLSVFVFDYAEGAVGKHREVKIAEGLPGWDGPYAVRFAHDGRRLLIPNGGHVGSKGTLSGIYIADVESESPTVTEIVPQVADGIEGVAVHPSGKLAVFSCLEESPRVVQPSYSHLAVVDLGSKPARLLYHLDVDSIPEGMEFSPDGTQLFVGLTYAHRIVTFDVDGFHLRRSPYVIRTGHGPVSMAIGPRFHK